MFSRKNLGSAVLLQVSQSLELHRLRLCMVLVVLWVVPSHFDVHFFQALNRKQTIHLFRSLLIEMFAFRLSLVDQLKGLVLGMFFCQQVFERCISHELHDLNALQGETAVGIPQSSCF